MAPRLIAAWPLERYQVWIAFSDGTEGAVDLEDQLTARTAGALRDVREFRQLRPDRALNLLTWPNGTGLDVTPLHRELRRRQRRQPLRR